MLRLFLQTYGCQMNQHDRLKIATLMEREGYALTDRLEEADCVILHTCSIREKPEHKVYSALGRLKVYKKRRPSMVIGVGGCVAQQAGERLLEEVPQLDFVFGTHHIHDVPRMVRMARAHQDRICQVSFSGRVPSLNLCPKPPAGSPTAYLAVMQGCDNFCSYCIVPFVKGREQSRPPQEIIEETRELALQGVREITLLGQNVNSYGRDQPDLPCFSELLERLHDIEDLHRIRFTTSHPKDLSWDLIEAIGRLEKVCQHLHLPVQSGSTRILSLMNRGYSRDGYLHRVMSLRDRIPDVALTTDVIVGFPGESDQDFEETLSLLETVRFDNIYSFKYSPRPMTRAAKLPGAVPEQVKKQRLKQLQERQEEISVSILRGCVGRKEEVLIEGPSPQSGGQATGRTRTYRIVHVPANSEELLGRLVMVLIESSLKHCLVGRVLPEKR